MRFAYRTSLNLPLTVPFVAACLLLRFAERPCPSLKGNLIFVNDWARIWGWRVWEEGEFFASFLTFIHASGSLVCKLRGLTADRRTPPGDLGASYPRARFAPSEIDRLTQSHRFICSACAFRCRCSAKSGSRSGTSA